MESLSNMNCMYHESVPCVPPCWRFNDRFTGNVFGNPIQVLNSILVTCQRSMIFASNLEFLQVPIQPVGSQHKIMRLSRMCMKFLCCAPRYWHLQNSNTLPRWATFINSNQNGWISTLRSSRCLSVWGIGPQVSHYWFWCHVQWIQSEQYGRGVL
jgi:hypothetical protein